MTDDEVALSIADIEHHARAVRQLWGDSTAVAGKCDDICYSLCDRLHAEESLPLDATSVEEQRIGPAGEENHYVCIINGDHVTDAAGSVYVDLSLDQFCDYNVELELVSVSLGDADGIERVRVMPPGDDRRGAYQSAGDWIEEQLSDI